MPLSNVQNYFGPGEAEAAYSATEVDLLPIGRMQFSMRVVRVEFENLWMHQVHESGPRIKQATQTPARAYFKFLTRPGEGFLIDGVTLRYQGLFRHCQGHQYYDRTSDSMD